MSPSKNTTGKNTTGKNTTGKNTTGKNTTGNPRSAKVAAKVAAQRAADARRETTRRHRLRAVVAVLVLAAVVVVGAIVQSQRGASTAGATPANLAGGVGYVAGRASAPVTVTVYEDFQCPVCRDFEATTGPTLNSLRDAGTVKVEYRPIAFLDRASSTRYSTRALDAVGLVLDTAPSAFLPFHDALYASQPAENSAGLPDTELAQLAKDAGAGDIGPGLGERTYEPWAARVTDVASKAGVTGTPTILVNGTALADRTPAGLTAAVKAATTG